MFTASDEDIDKVREVAGESDYVFVSGLIDNLTDAQWERAQDFMLAWDQFAPGDVSLTLSGGRDGVGLSDQMELDDVRRRMRLLLGLSEFRIDDFGGAVSQTVLNQWRW